MATAMLAELSMNIQDYTDITTMEKGLLNHMVLLDMFMVWELLYIQGLHPAM